MRSKKNPFALFENIKTVIAETQHYIVRNVNAAMILAYFQIGKMIVEDEQQGSQRAEYAKETLIYLSRELNKEFGKGYSVSFDLKIGKLTHQDIGQMQMYVNYYDRKIKTKDENPTIGIILCKEENRTVIEFTLSEGNNQIFAKEYKAVLPSKEALKKQLE